MGVLWARTVDGGSVVTSLSGNQHLRVHGNLVILQTYQPDSEHASPTTHKLYKAYNNSTANLILARLFGRMRNGEMFINFGEVIAEVVGGNKAAACGYDERDFMPHQVDFWRPVNPDYLELAQFNVDQSYVVWRSGAEIESGRAVIAKWAGEYMVSEWKGNHFASGYFNFVPLIDFSHYIVIGDPLA